MKALAALTVALVPALVVAAPSSPIRPAAGHPLIGKWQWTLKQSGCTEVYEYRADGSATVLSGTEKTDNSYVVEPQPDASGFYRTTIRTTKDYGGKDCGDEESDSTGMESTNFIIFHKSGKMMLVCMEPKLERCLGPLTKVEGK